MATVYPKVSRKIYHAFRGFDTYPFPTQAVFCAALRSAIDQDDGQALVPYVTNQFAQFLLLVQPVTSKNQSLLFTWVSKQEHIPLIETMCLFIDASEGMCLDCYNRLPLSYAKTRVTMAPLLKSRSLVKRINFGDIKQRTPLHYAALGGTLRTIELLLQHGAKPNVEDDVGNTPLHYAVYRGRYKAARSLIAAGADVTYVNRYGKTPILILCTTTKAIDWRMGKALLTSEMMNTFLEKTFPRRYACWQYILAAKEPRRTMLFAAFRPQVRDYCVKVWLALGHGIRNSLSQSARDSLPDEVLFPADLMRHILSVALGVQLQLGGRWLL
eukprot:TRINITY_DN9826_c0_g1_i1.p1 TRINITY_DN9826_c0_g1~~TRINITY_DN9826_c0_g1_i1.p1  ORF type:complete len:334 (-),score=53.26 TRINITY_DN9826_c0_g1_i1:237-1217(-)